VASFADVPTDHWAYKYVEYAYAQNIVRGYRPGEYGPDDMVDRAAMAGFISRAMVAPEGDAAIPTPIPVATFPDVPTDQWAWKWVEYCYATSVVKGYSDGYRPDELVTRAQMAVFVQKAFDLPT
jgi:hypothetical protein